MSAVAQSAADNAANQAEQIQRDNAAAQRQLELDRLRRNNAPSDREAPEAPERLATVDGEECIDVQHVTVEGVTLVSPSAVRKAVAEYEGTCLSLTELNNILRQVTFLYLEQGFITSRAFLPEQDLADGGLEIVVVEGSLEGIMIDNETGKYASQTVTAFPHLVGKPVNLRDIEQGLDQLNRLRSNNAQIELEAGEEQGGSVLSVNRNRTGKNWYGSVGVDNLGSTSTGKYQTRVDFGLEDVFGVNDIWNFGYQRSMDKHPLFFKDQAPKSDTLTGSLSIPYGYWTLALNTSWSRYNSEVDGPVSKIDTSGASQSISVDISRVIHRDQTSKTSISGDLVWKNSENFILGSRVDTSSRKLAIASVEIIDSRQLLGGQLASSVQYNQGLNILGAFDDEAAPDGSPEGQFSSINASINYVRPVKIVGLNASYNGTLSGQWTPDLLFGSEQVSYGGLSTVRGVRESVVFGNLGVMSRNEFAVDIPMSDQNIIKRTFGQLQAYSAIDFGHVFDQNQFGIDSGNLTGATIGLRTRGGAASFDIAYSDIISSSSNLNSAVSNSGIIYSRAGFSF